MQKYEVFNAISGASLGVYTADSERDAIVAMLVDADCLDAASDDLRARIVEEEP